MNIDAYTLIAPRPIDVIRTLDSARADGVDAVVVSINAIWLTDEWSDAFVAEPRRVEHRHAVEIAVHLALGRLIDNTRGRGVEDHAGGVPTRGGSEPAQRECSRDRRYVRHGGTPGRPSAAAGEAGPDDRDPRLPDNATEFWLIQEYGVSIMDDTTRRVATMVDGLDDDSPVADALNLQLLQSAEAAGIPVYLYVAPFSPEALTDPELAVAANQVEAYWMQLAGRVTSPLVEIEPHQLTSRFAERAAYIDVVHMADAGPFADVLVPLLCANWQTAHPTEECS